MDHPQGRERCDKAPDFFVLAAATAFDDEGGAVEHERAEVAVGLRRARGRKLRKVQDAPPAPHLRDRVDRDRKAAQPDAEPAEFGDDGGRRREIALPRFGGGGGGIGGAKGKGSRLCFLPFPPFLFFIFGLFLSPASKRGGGGWGTLFSLFLFLQTRQKLAFKNCE